MIKKKLTQVKKKKKIIKIIKIKPIFKKKKFTLKKNFKYKKKITNIDRKKADLILKYKKSRRAMRSRMLKLIENFKLKKRLLKNLKKRKLLRGLKSLKLYRYSKGLRKKHYTQKITIKITPNNIFCLIKNLKKNKTEYVVSGGRIGLNLSKKKIKFLWKTVITDLFEYMQKIELESFIFSYSGPRRLKKKIIRLFKKTFRPRRKRSSRYLTTKDKTPKKEEVVVLPNKSPQRALLMTVNPKKVFNGCRVKKKKRKKRGGFFRVFK